MNYKKMNPIIRRKHMLKKPTKQSRRFCGKQCDNVMPVIKKYSFYLYSKQQCTLEQFDGTDLFIEGLKIMLGEMPIEEGSFQMGRVVYNNNVLVQVENFVAKWADACPQVRRLPAYFRKLNEGDYFYIIDASFPTINRQIALVWLWAHYAGVDARKVRDNYLLYHGYLKYKYNYYSFGFDARKIFEGEVDKSKRTCRFCHGVTKENERAEEYKKQGIPIVKFGNKTNAHAISDALGNKLLFCLEECETCNNSLAKVENNFIALMDWRRALFGVKKKDNEAPNVFGKESAIRTNDDGSQTLYIDQDALVGREVSEGSYELRLNNKKIMSPQGVYRALCKYVIDLMPASYLPHFSQTIEWIKGNVNTVSLPKVLVTYNMPFVSQPVLDMYFYKGKDGCQPLCTALLHVCDTCYLFILPFADTDEAHFLGEGKLDNHWAQFKQFMPFGWSEEDMSDYRPSSPWIEMSLSKGDTHVKIVPHDDSHLKQPISKPKEGAKKKEIPEEEVFPAFDMGQIHITGTRENKFEILNENPIAPDALHGATIECNDITIFADLRNNTVSVYADFVILDPTGKIPYLEYDFNTDFVFDNLKKHLVITDDYLAFDYQLSVAAFYLGCINADNFFKKRVDQTQYAICTVVKTLCNDERTIHHIKYVVTSEKGCVYEFYDKNVHNNPFDF